MTWGVQSIWDGDIMIYGMKEDPATLLPKEFVIQSGKPAIFIRLIGHHSEGEYLVDDTSHAVWPALNSYNEAIWLIPWVVDLRQASYPAHTPHLFISRMLIDKLIPVFLGNYFFCYRKKYDPLIHKNYETNSTRIGERLFESFSEIEALLNMPIYGTTVDHHNKLLRMVRSQWHINSTYACLSERRSDQVTFHATLNWRLFLP